MAVLQIAIYGAGGHGREVAWLLACCAEAGEACEAVCFIDDDERLQDTHVDGLPVYSLQAARRRFPEARVLGGVGAPALRERLMTRAAAQGFGFATAVHPRVERSRRVTIGPGTVICAGSVLTTNITLGEHVQINTACTVAHDVVLGDYATLAPGVHVSGCVHLGRRAYVGTGASIINGTPGAPLTIGDDAVVGAGACVVRSVPAGQTVVGVPARPLG